MIKINVLVSNKNWKKYIKNPTQYLKIKLKKLNKDDSFFKKRSMEFSILLSDKKEIQKINYKFRGKNKQTDILSFPFNELKELKKLLKGKKHFYLGVKGIRGNCEHIGSTKSDEILKKYSEKKQINYEAGLFFSSAKDKLNGIPEEISQRLDILNKVEQFHINFIKVANKFYDKKFLIKMKKNQHKYQYLQPLLKKYDTKLGPNISLKSETDNAQLLISKSKKIFVFHSTIISEAILMNKDVIEPKFEPINDLEKSYLFTGNFENATIKVDNANEIERVINLESLNTDTRHKNELINYYLGPCDGKVFDRFISHL